MRNIAQTEQAKVDYIAQKLGISLRSVQQTERVIYDTTDYAAGPGQANFFREFSGKTLTESNVTTNKLDSNEVMVVKNIVLSSGDSQFTEAPLLDFYVGGQRVIKELPLIFGSPEFTFEPIYNSANSQYISLRLLTNIVIPPQIEYYAVIRHLTPVAESHTLTLQGYGLLFNSGNTY